MPNITDELSIEANSVDPEQTAPSSLNWVHTICHRGFLNISADEKSRRLLLRLALYGFNSMCDKHFGHLGLQPDSYYKPTTIHLTASQAINELLWFTVL